MPTIINFPGLILNSASGQISYFAIEVSGLDLSNYKVNYTGSKWGGYNNQSVFWTIQDNSTPNTYWLFIVAYGNPVPSSDDETNQGPQAGDPGYTVTITSDGGTSPPLGPASVILYSDPTPPTNLP